MTLSSEAENFVRRGLGRVVEAFAFEDIAARRADNLARYGPGSLRAVERHEVLTTDTTLAGVPCLEIVRRDGAADLTVLFCFGGGMITGSPFESLPISAALAQLARARVICPAYRLAPEYPFPHGLDDVVCAYRALRHRTDIGPLAMAGESAGGNLVIGLLRRLERAERPSAAALMSPWCDLTHGGESLAFNDRRDPTLEPGYIREAARAYAAGRDAAEPGISPLLAAYDPSFPETLITTGTRDLLLSDSVRLSQILRTAGVAVDLRVWEGLWHVFEFYAEVPEASQSLAEIARFLRSRSGCPALG